MSRTAMLLALALVLPACADPSGAPADLIPSASTSPSPTATPTPTPTPTPTRPETGSVSPPDEQDHDDPEPAPKRTAAAEPPVTHVSAGANRACAVKGGAVYCWGRGYLGDGHWYQGRSTPVRVKDLSNVVEVAVGDEHACARREGGDIKCWGWHAFGQLGHGGDMGEAEEGTKELTPVSVASDRTFVSLRAGGSHNCAIDDTKELWCWGRGWSGQLGDGRGENSPTPIRVRGLPAVRAVDAGNEFTCVILRDGTMRCWGHNYRGQLGNGAELYGEGEKSPVEVQELRDADTLALGGMHVCVKQESRNGVCWGFNGYGQLGDGTTDDRSIPAPVDLEDVRAFAAGSNASCAITDRLLCWGNDQDGGDDVSEPIPVDLDDVSQLDGGSMHMCALADGDVWCWGENRNGQLGDGTTKARWSPVRVKGL